MSLFPDVLDIASERTAENFSMCSFSIYGFILSLLGEEGAVCFRVKDDLGKSFIRLIPVSGLIAIEFSDEDLLSLNKKVDDSDKTTYFS